MNNHFNLSREGVESGCADDGAGVGFVDCHMWLGAEETSVIHFYCVEDCGFVRPEDVDIPVRHA